MWAPSAIRLISLAFLSLAACGEFSSAAFTDGSTDEGPPPQGTNNAVLQGPYGYSFAGFQDGGRFVAAVGRVVLDGAGVITSGSQRRTEEGGFEFSFTVSGSYAVGAEGTGTLTMRFDGSVDTWRLVVVDAGRRVKLVSVEPNNFLNGALLGEMEKQ